MGRDSRLGARTRIAARALGAGAGVTGVVFGLLVALGGGGGGDGHGRFATGVSAESATSHLEISAAPPAPALFVAELQDVWVLLNATPGESTVASVLLRRVGVPSPVGLTLRLTASFDSVGMADAMAASTIVTTMELDGIPLISFWPAACRTGVTMTVAQLRACPTAPELPLPNEQGSVFEMRLLLSQDTPNALQGATTGEITFTFTLESADEATPSAPTNTPVPTATRTATAVPSPPTATSSPAATATSSATPSATATRPATATPPAEGTSQPQPVGTTTPQPPRPTPGPPDTGSGVSLLPPGTADGGLVIAALAGLVAAMIVAAAARRRR